MGFTQLFWALKGWRYMGLLGFLASLQAFGQAGFFSSGMARNTSQRFATARQRRVAGATEMRHGCSKCVEKREPPDRRVPKVKGKKVMRGGLMGKRRRSRRSPRRKREGAEDWRESFFDTFLSRVLIEMD
jgi:hypothetical protein